nr:hypothetical protein [Streptomyces malaysiensis]
MSASIPAGKVDPQVSSDRAGRQDQYTVGEHKRFLHVMGDEQDGARLVQPEPFHELLHFDPGDGVQCAERLVQEQEFRVVQQGTGEGDSLLLPSGQFGRPDASPAVQAHGPQQRTRLVPAAVDAQLDVVLDAAPGQQPVLLEHHAGRDGLRSASAQGDTACARLFEARDDPQQCALADATGAEEGDEGAGLDLQVEVLQNPPIAVPPTHRVEQKPGTPRRVSRRHGDGRR